MILDQVPSEAQEKNPIPVGISKCRCCRQCQLRTAKRSAVPSSKFRFGLPHAGCPRVDTPISHEPAERSVEPRTNPHQDVLGDVRARKKYASEHRAVAMGVKGDASILTKAKFHTGLRWVRYGEFRVPTRRWRCRWLSMGLNRRPVPLPVVCGTRYTHAKPEKWSFVLPRAYEPRDVLLSSGVRVHNAACDICDP